MAGFNLQSVGFVGLLSGWPRPGQVEESRMVNDEEHTGATPPGPLRYFGTWYDDFEYRWLGSRERFTLTAGDWVELDFYATQVHLVCATGPNTPAPFEVFLDGLSRGYGSQYSATISASAVDVYSITGLPLGNHTIRVVVGGAFNFDGFRVGP